MPALLELANLIHENGGSLGGAFLAHTLEVQAAGINELIRSNDPEKAESLLSLLSTEGMYVWSKGEQPPPLLTLVKARLCRPARCVVKATRSRCGSWRRIPG